MRTDDEIVEGLDLRAIDALARQAHYSPHHAAQFDAIWRSQGQSIIEAARERLSAKESFERAVQAHALTNKEALRMYDELTDNLASLRADLDHMSHMLGRAIAERDEARGMLDKAEEALAPFVEWSAPDIDLADQLRHDLVSYDDDCEADISDFKNDGFSFFWRDFRRARAVLSDLRKAKEPTL